MLALGLCYYTEYWGKLSEGVKLNERKSKGSCFSKEVKSSVLWRSFEFLRYQQRYTMWSNTFIFNRRRKKFCYLLFSPRRKNSCLILFHFEVGIKLVCTRIIGKEICLLDISQKICTVCATVASGRVYCVLYRIYRFQKHWIVDWVSSWYSEKQYSCDFSYLNPQPLNIPRIAIIMFFNINRHVKRTCWYLIKIISKYLVWSLPLETPLLWIYTCLYCSISQIPILSDFSEYPIRIQSHVLIYTYVLKW